MFTAEVAGTTAAVAGLLSLGLGSTHVDLRLCKNDVAEPTTSVLSLRALAPKTIQPEGGLRRNNRGDEELTKLPSVSKNLRVDGYGWTTPTFKDTAAKPALRRDCYSVRCDVQAPQTKDDSFLLARCWPPSGCCVRRPGSSNGGRAGAPQNCLATRFSNCCVGRHNGRT